MLQKFIKDERKRSVTVFIIRAILLYTLWFISYDFFIAPSGKVDTWLNERVAIDAAHLLDIFGLNGSTTPGINQIVVRIHGVDMVGVGNPCNGLELFVLFAGFILCFPGGWKNKLWFIPLGSIAIHIVNAARTAALAVIQYKAPEHLDFNHHYTFTIIVYAFIFFLWITWTNRFSQTGKKTANESKPAINA